MARIMYDVIQIKILSREMMMQERSQKEWKEELHQLFPTLFPTRRSKPDLHHGKNKSSMLYFLNEEYNSTDRYDKLKIIAKDDPRIPKLVKFIKTYPTMWDAIQNFFYEYRMSSEWRDEFLKLSELYK